MIPTFNPLECAERLTAAAIPPDQAKAFAKEYSHMANSLMDHLATKADLKVLEDRIDARFERIEDRIDANEKRSEDRLKASETQAGERLNTAIADLKLSIGKMIFAGFTVSLTVLKFMV